MELIERPKRKKDRNKSRLALSLIRARPATCANETAEKWPENGPTDSPVVNPDCKRAFIIRRPGEGEGEGKCTMENLGDASFLPLFSIEVTMSRRKFTSNYCYGGSPEFLPSLRFFFFVITTRPVTGKNDCVSNFIVSCFCTDSMDFF